MRIWLASCHFLLIATACFAQPAKETCVDVQVGTAQSYACLNQKLQDVARGAANAQTGADAPYSAAFPGNVTGQFNESATRNRLGSNFGKSVTSQRPSNSFSAAPPAPR